MNIKRIFYILLNTYTLICLVNIKIKFKIFLKDNNIELKELILKCIEMIANLCFKNLKSGWKYHKLYFVNVFSYIYIIKREFFTNNFIKKNNNPDSKFSSIRIK